ncbi:MAG: selenium-dependent xanthine dehydrogenase [Spirochaetaceae bacterium]|jgi:CO/xanthine dehydrogenase Mo-binding subunit/aerobic-type carbon monoxide dehydrogenase small subunit (CoxS/CutS family)|nr:selenium-dependent xanthine dehydrogenase [Spirochaetaceae bacterium]
MVELTVNGVLVKGNESKKLIDFLREDLRLTATKNGCGSGACGACTVLIDGKASRACIPTLAKTAGKSVVTLEGLSEREKAVYAYAFAEAGAVQCGFCIPGMVMSAKALLDVNNAPDDGEIRKAIRSNICRCTGYIKIKDAIRLAAELFRDNAPVPERRFTGRLGETFHRVDAAAKTLGTGIYADDISKEGMLYASALRAAHPRARILKIDPGEALAHPDCAAVFTAKDVPGNNKIGHLEFISDYDVMIREGDITRFIGDAVALVVARKKETLDAIKALVKVDYEVLEPITSPLAAMADDAPIIHVKDASPKAAPANDPHAPPSDPHGGVSPRAAGPAIPNVLSHEHLVRGDAEAVLAASKFVVTRHYSVPFTEHAFMEPECAVAEPEGDGVALYTGGQSIYDEQRECARMLGLERDKVHVIGQLVGGGFGGKEDMSVQHHAALAAYLLQKPVKVLLTRQESINLHPKRHAMEIDLTTGCDENGILTAMKAAIVSDTGAYASLGGPVLQRACTHAAGPYNYQVIDIDGKAVYTNNPPGGAFRGFGVCQSNFAVESNLNLLAEMVGISPWEIRYRNAIRPGQSLPNGQIAGDDTELEACLLKLKEPYEAAVAAGKAVGIAAALKNAGVGVGIPDTGRCILSVEGGVIHIRSSAACIGQGFATVTTQIVCETVGVTPEQTLPEPPDTRRTPNSGTTTASRQTVVSGEAVRRAAEKLKTALDAAGGNLASLEGEEFYGEFTTVTDPMGSDKPNPVSHVAYGYAATLALLDAEGKVERVIAAYDLGTVVNPKSAEGQIEGGLLMGMGYALTEDFPLEGGIPKVKYGTLGLLRATDAPEMEVYLVNPSKRGGLSYGTKGVGELATIPVCPAIGGAYYVRDGVLRDKLPMANTAYRK